MFFQKFRLRRARKQEHASEKILREITNIIENITIYPGENRFLYNQKSLYGAVIASLPQPRKNNTIQITFFLGNLYQGPLKNKKIKAISQKRRYSHIVEIKNREVTLRGLPPDPFSFQIF